MQIGPESSIPDTRHVLAAERGAPSAHETWLAILADPDPLRAIGRLTRDAALELEVRCLDRLRHAAVLLDLARVHLAAAARLALHAPQRSPMQPLAPWIEACIDGAIAGLVDEDAIDERDDRPVAPDDERYAALAAQLGIDARTLRRAAVVFQRLPHDERAAFWSVVIDGTSLAEHAEATSVPVRVASRRFERAVASFCSLGTRRGPEFPSPEESRP